ncbi:CAP domain-containing protein [Streptomyces xanthophaeus]|nr:CAP domain-containing protein [Streptomyces xanthophaeus]
MKNSTRTHRRVRTLAAALMAGGILLTAGSGSAFAEVSPADQAAMLAETNKVRQDAGQQPLTWDAALASASQAWADNPASSANNRLNHGPISNGAENMSSSAPSAAVGQWANEKAGYDADPNHDSNSTGYKTVWGHYANMINPSYTKMGCGAKSGVSIPGGWVTVCQYSP